MLTIVIVPIVAIGSIWLWRKVRRSKDYWNNDAYYFPAFIAGIWIGFVAAMFLGSSVLLTRTESNTALFSVGNRTEIHGSVFLLSGRIDSKNYLTYWYQDGPGYRQATVSMDANPLVIEDATPETASLHKYQNVCDPGWFTICISGKVMYEFHIPPGSLVPDFTLQ